MIRSAALALVAGLALSAPASPASPSAPEIAPKVFVPSFPEQPDRLERSGSFSIAYRPRLCVRAPCAPGTYTIRAGERRLAVVGVVVVERSGHRPARSYKGRCLPFASIEGHVRIELGTAFLRIRRVMEPGAPC